MGHVNIPYTYMCERGNETFTSKVDHFIACKSLCDNIGECFIIDEFYSDHVAVKMSISVAVPHIDISNDVIVHSDKVDWHRANDNNIETYKELDNEKLKQIRFDSDLFKYMNITCLEHNNMLQFVYEDVLSICISSADKCIPKVNAGHCREQRVPGWHDHVAEYHQEALYLHYWWKVEGMPHQGHTSEMRRISRARYHMVHKIIMKEQFSTRKEKMAEAVYHNNSRDLFSEVR